MKTSEPAPDRIVKWLATALVVISLAGISLSLLGIFGGVLGTGVLYFWPNPTQPALHWVAPPPTSTPIIFADSRATATVQKKKKTPAVQTTMAEAEPAYPAPQTSETAPLTATLMTPSAASATLTPPPLISETSLAGPTVPPTLSSQNPTTVLTPTATSAVSPSISTATAPPPSPTSTTTPVITIELVALTNPVVRGSNASITVKTLPNQVCMISYVQPDSEEPAIQELSPVMSEANGLCSWEWFIAADTPLGTATITLTVDAISNTYLFQIIN